MIESTRPHLQTITHADLWTHIEGHWPPSGIISKSWWRANVFSKPHPNHTDNDPFWPMTWYEKSSKHRKWSILTFDPIWKVIDLHLLLSKERQQSHDAKDRFLDGLDTRGLRLVHLEAGDEGALVEVVGMPVEKPVVIAEEFIADVGVFSNHLILVLKNDLKKNKWQERT